jgi:hypothetical protein
MFSGLAMMVAGAILLWQQGRQPSAQAEPPDTADHRQRQPANGAAKDAGPHAWKDLFDGKTLDGWKVPQFGGEGKVFVEDGRIVMEMGSMMTGIAKIGEVIRDNYELQLEGMRINGSDFFCTTTFPVGKDSCSLVVGGWGGAVVGLSNVDHADASENGTIKMMSFKRGQWYRVRIRVSNAAIEAWIDDEEMVDQPRKDHAIGIRMECDLCRPLGISTWCTAGAARNIRVRALKTEEVQAIQEAHDRAAEEE